MRRLLALALAALAVAPAHAAEPPPEKGPVVFAGHVLGLVFVRPSPEDVIATDILLVQDGNMQLPGEPVQAVEERRTYVGGLEVRCYVETRTCEIGKWFLREVPPGSFVYDPVRGEARLHAVLSKKETIDAYVSVADPVPGVLRPNAGTAPSGEFVVTGGEGVTREISGSANLFGIQASGGGGSLISGVLHNVYLDL